MIYPTRNTNSLTQDQEMPTELQTFFQSMAGAIHTGTAVHTVTETPTATPSKEDEEEEEGVMTEETSTSEDAARPTGASGRLLTAAVGMAGVVGVALAL